MKTLTALVVGTVISLCLWWLAFDVLLKDFFSNNTVHYANLMKYPPVYWAKIASSLLWVSVIGFTLSKSANDRNLMGGMVVGAVVTFLISASTSTMFYAAWNLYARRALAVDVLVVTIIGAITGGLMGWIMGMEKKV